MSDEHDDDAVARPDRLGPGEPRSFGNNRYVVQRRLGAGNFATVYLAFDERLDVSVAVKLLSDRWSWEPEVRGRFVQEARILRSLNDRRVVQIRDISETDDGRPFIVMDYATEGTLDLRLTERAHAGVAATPDELRDFAAELTAALGFLHARRIAHRDIKPSNILITRDDLAPGAAHAHRSADSLLRPGERLMLGDLGLAKDLRLDSGITVGVGTAGYMSPEQAEMGAKIDTRTDIYAASALMGLVASGESPDPLRRFTQGALTSGRPLPDRITGTFRAALQRGLDENPDHRHQTIEEWFDDVDAGLALRRGTPFPPPPPPPPPGPVVPSSPGSHPTSPPGAQAAAQPPAAPQSSSQPPAAPQPGWHPASQPNTAPDSSPGVQVAVRAVGAPNRNRLVAAAAGVLVLLGVAGVWVATRGEGEVGAGRSTEASSEPTDATDPETTPETTAEATTTSSTTTSTTTPPTTSPMTLPTTVAPVVTTAAPTTAAPSSCPSVFIVGPTTIRPDTPGRYWEVDACGVVNGVWELFNTAGPIPLDGDQWFPGDGFQADLPAGAYVLRLTAFDLAGAAYPTELSFTVL